MYSRVAFTFQQAYQAHQHANFEPNLFRNGAIISADVHTCLPVSNQSLLHGNMSIFSMFLPKWGWTNFPGVYRLIIHPYLPSKSLCCISSVALSNLTNLCILQLWYNQHTIGWLHHGRTQFTGITLFRWRATEFNKQGSTIWLWNITIQNQYPDLRFVRGIICTHMKLRQDTDKYHSMIIHLYTKHANYGHRFGR